MLFSTPMRSVRRPRFDTSLDRAGWALAAGAGLGGAVWLVLMLGAGGATLLAAVTALMLGSFFTAAAIVSLGLPLWLVLHLNGRRAMGHAALLGAAIGFVLCLFALTHGFGLWAVADDAATTWMRWISAAATSAVFAAVAATIAVVMWAVAYRPVGRDEALTLGRP